MYTEKLTQNVKRLIEIGRIPISTIFVVLEDRDANDIHYAEKQKLYGCDECDDISVSLFYRKFIMAFV